MKNKERVIYCINRILPIIFIIVLAVMLDKFKNYAEKEALFEILFIVSFLTMLVYGILFGWFLCGNISINSKGKGTWLIIFVLIAFSIMPVWYYSFNFDYMSLIYLNLLSIIKCFQMALGMFLFLIIHKRVKNY